MCVLQKQFSRAGKENRIRIRWWCDDTKERWLCFALKRERKPKRHNFLFKPHNETIFIYFFSFFFLFFIYYSLSCVSFFIHTKIQGIFCFVGLVWFNQSGVARLSQIIFLRENTTEEVWLGNLTQQKYFCWELKMEQEHWSSTAGAGAVAKFKVNWTHYDDERIIIEDNWVRRSFFYNATQWITSKSCIRVCCLSAFDFELSRNRKVKCRIGNQRPNQTKCSFVCSSLAKLYTKYRRAMFLLLLLLLLVNSTAAIESEYIHIFVCN